MSADNYISIIQGKDGKFRGYMAFASDEHDPSAHYLEFDADDLEDAVKKAQSIRTEYGYEVRFWDEEKEKKS